MELAYFSDQGFCLYIVKCVELVHADLVNIGCPQVYRPRFPHQRFEHSEGIIPAVLLQYTAQLRVV